MRKYLYTLITLLLVPVLVNAETLEYNICKSGCEYNSIVEVLNHTLEIYNEVGEEPFYNYNVIINFKDSETYEGDSFGYFPVNNLTINGNNNNIVYDSVYLGFTNDVTLNNLNFTARIVELSFINNITINNINIAAKEVTFLGKIDSSKLGDSNYNEYKNSVFNINNCSIKAIDNGRIALSAGIFNISNSSLSGFQTLLSILSDISIHNSSLSTILLLAGSKDGNWYDTNVYLNLNDLDKNKKIIRGLYTEENVNELLRRYPELNESNIQLDKYFFIEFPLTEEHINNGITKTSNIFIKQEVSKITKTNTSISEFESEFVNTYEDSIGYDDIKDLPIEWKSENDSVAKIENGIIIPVNPGSVDLVGTRGNDIYTIHLTVEKETIPEKIDKMTIKVPITGSKVKAWVVVIGALLLGIIGTCSYMLIRRKK